MSSAFWGGVLGLLAGLLASLFLQLTARLHEPAGMCFSGAPKGVDDWIYYSLLRAVWRGGNLFTYSYPYALLWPTPRVLIQAPITAISWPAHLIGIPAAFELARVLGSALGGFAIGAICGRLLPGRGRKAILGVVLGIGGGWYSWLAAGYALRTGSVLNLLAWPDYLRSAMGQYYSWLPCVSENLMLPLEVTYHALVLGALAALLCERYWLAAVLGLVTWFSNPFPAVALSAVALPWWVWRVWESSGEGRRRAVTHLALWGAIVAVGFGYYSVFLPRWPALADLCRLHQIPLSPPFNPLQLLLVCGPGLPFLAWASLSRSARRHLWGSAPWRLFAILAVTQCALVEQGMILGEKATQPHHFNRGYMVFGFGVVLYRCLMILGRGKRAFPLWATLVLGSVCLDQPLFWLNTVREGPSYAGMVSRDLKAVVEETQAYGRDKLVISDVVDAYEYLAAYTQHQAYDASSPTVIPFQEKRRKMLEDALKDPSGCVSKLGGQMAIVQEGGQYQSLLERQGWKMISKHGKIGLMAP